MELKDLRIFIAVADTAGLRRAATRLNIQQSVVSKRLRDLEEELGVSLFERHQAGVTLTHAGDRFDSDVRPLLFQLDEAVRSVRAAGQASEGRLRIGLSGSLSSGFPRLLVERWRSEHPLVKLEMKEWGPQEQIRGLLNRQIDVTFLTGETSPVGCEAIPIFRAQLYAAVWDGSVFKRQTELQFEELAKQHFIVSSRGFGSEIRDLIAKQLSELGFSPDVETIDVGREALMTMVGMNFGVSLTSDVSIGVSYPGVAFVPIAGELLPVNAVYSPENDNPALRRFLSLARTLAKEQTRDAPSQKPDLSP